MANDNIQTFLISLCFIQVKQLKVCKAYSNDPIGGYNDN